MPMCNFHSNDRPYFPEEANSIRKAGDKQLNVSKQGVTG